MQFVASIAALCLGSLPLAGATSPTTTAPSELSSERLKDEIDLGLRWLRTQQVVETGAYGNGSAEETAVALRTFAASPRAYRRADGPFIARAIDFLASQQRDDGAFPDGDIQRPRIEAHTATVLAALEDLEEPRGDGSMHARAIEYLGDKAKGYVVLHAPVTFASAETAAARAEELLEMRDPDGTWPDGFLKPGPSLMRTAHALRELSAAHDALRAAEPAPPKRSASPLPPIPTADRARVAVAMERGAAYLAHAADDGRWGAMGRADAGITAMVLAALLALPEPGEDVGAVADEGLDWLVSLQKPDGSIHDGQLANYVTSASVLALVKAGRGDSDVVRAARGFLQTLQADEGEGYDPSHHYYGGVGYGGDERPDLSNLQMALEALAAAGVEQGDDTFRKALRFLERTQNRSESNDVSLEVGGVRTHAGDDGGGVYAPGDSKAGFVVLSDGSRVPRSYGSMTYALLKGYLFAGLPREDPRVESAWKWLRENYTLDVNPGFESSSDPTAAYQGLYYYFYTMARALDLYGEERVTDAAGVEHAWRVELSGRLLAMQRQDGSWINDNSPRWWEGNPVLATAYAMLTLEAAFRVAD